MVYRKYNTKDFEGYFVILSGTTRDPPTRQLCENYRRQYNLSMPVLYDKNGRMQGIGMGDQHVHYVTERGGKLKYIAQFEDDGFQAALDVLLSD